MKLALPQGWLFDRQTAENVSASCGMREIEVTCGEMPADATAQDQAFDNFLEMVGFDSDDADDYNPIFTVSFNNRKAYGFEAWVDDTLMIRVLCLEYRKGQLCVLSVVAPEKMMDETIGLVERGLRF